MIAKVFQTPLVGLWPDLSYKEALGGSSPLGKIMRAFRRIQPSFFNHMLGWISS